MTSCSVSKQGGSWPGAAAQNLTGHWLANNEQLQCASPVLYILIIMFIIIIIFFLFCPFKLSLSQTRSFLTSNWGERGVSKWLCDAWLLAGVKPQ